MCNPFGASTRGNFISLSPPTSSHLYNNFIKSSSSETDSKVQITHAKRLTVVLYDVVTCTVLRSNEEILRFQPSPTLFRGIVSSLLRIIQSDSVTPNSYSAFTIYNEMFGYFLSEVYKMSDPFKS